MTDSSSKPASGLLLEQLSATPLLWMVSAFLGGIIFSSRLALPWWAWLATAGLALLIALVIRWLRPQAALALLLLPALFGLGAARYAWGQHILAEKTIVAYNDLDQTVYITGTLSKPPEVRDTYMNLRIDVKAIDIGKGDIPVDGTILVRLTNDYDLAYGDPVRVRGRLETPPEDEDFSYREYLLRQGIHSILLTNNITLLPRGEQRSPFWAFLYRLRASLYKEVNALFPLHDGGIFLDGSLGDLRRRVSGERRLIADLAEGTSEVAVAGAKVLERQGNRVVFAFDPERTPAAELIARVAAAYEVRDLFVENPPIEELVAKLYGEQRG